MSPCRSSLDVPCQGSAKVATLYEERFKNCFQNPFFYFNSINLLRLLEHAQGRASSTRGDPKIVSLVAQRVLQVFDVVLKRRDWTRSSISRNLRLVSCTRCISQTYVVFPHISKDDPSGLRALAGHQAGIRAVDGEQVDW